MDMLIVEEATKWSFFLLLKIMEIEKNFKKLLQSLSETCYCSSNKLSETFWEENHDDYKRYSKSGWCFCHNGF